MKSQNTIGDILTAALVVFVILKLVGIVNCSWFCVLWPLWVGLVVAILFMAAAGIMMIIQAIVRLLS